ncbi:MAG: polyprenyl synthetase family protein [Rhodothermales bacterium]|nr:polyprenyl synthetase family protein [Rhodothermales bacterium]
MPQASLAARSPDELAQTLRELVDAGLFGLEPALEPPSLYEPVRYVLQASGKRVRPVLLLLTAEALGADRVRALPAALAVEVFHNFTLVHDDIMDHALTRRGAATVHARWDESTAILCGDYLVALSYDLLARVDSPHLPDLFGTYFRMVRHLCEGQAMDKEFESRSDVTVEEYFQMIYRKTGALIETSFELGGWIAGADAKLREALRDLGRHVGLAFQIQDDLLDLVADDARWGKKVGGDLQEAKKTYLLLRALEVAEGDDRAWFRRIVDTPGLPEAEIGEARARMDRLGVLEEARRAVLKHSEAALAGLAVLPESSARATLHHLIARLQHRIH